MAKKYLDANKKRIMQYLSVEDRDLLDAWFELEEAEISKRVKSNIGRENTSKGVLSVAFLIIVIMLGAFSINKIYMDWTRFPATECPSGLIDNPGWKTIGTRHELLEFDDGVACIRYRDDNTFFCKTP